jgi:hypothetical protein
MAGECKFRSESFGKTELDAFLDKVEALDCGEPYLILFSLSGYTDYVKNKAENAKLLTLSDMY